MKICKKQIQMASSIEGVESTQAIISEAGQDDDLPLSQILCARKTAEDSDDDDKPLSIVLLQSRTSLDSISKVSTTRTSYSVLSFAATSQRTSQVVNNQQQLDVIAPEIPTSSFSSYRVSKTLDVAAIPAAISEVGEEPEVPGSELRRSASFTKRRSRAQSASSNRQTTTTPSVVLSGNEKANANAIVDGLDDATKKLAHATAELVLNRLEPFITETTSRLASLQYSLSQLDPATQPQQQHNIKQSLRVSTGGSGGATPYVRNSYSKHERTRESDFKDRRSSTAFIAPKFEDYIPKLRASETEAVHNELNPLLVKKLGAAPKVGTVKSRVEEFKKRGGEEVINETSSEKPAPVPQKRTLSVKREKHNRKTSVKREKEASTVIVNGKQRSSCLRCEGKGNVDGLACSQCVGTGVQMEANSCCQCHSLGFVHPGDPYSCRNAMQGACALGEHEALALVFEMVCSPVDCVIEGETWFLEEFLRPFLGSNFDYAWCPNLNNVR
ncbi:hypothetical protein BCR33DRAFT_761115 [Rhizoclosmatium globosum]|uniref:Uncharacterized protein n=1 Tax=Rhizoclosmatium globosum TaxID=329046 RepID=A0A1Y2D3V7_9FUNG|nr:hypothetical protein BCR33DRAFT_761115 [Rhizoclosmatium globosum]|eukprot:ORY53796.1 hypothetical protein BCR33DRAFT_761115 [Rhizoclosmatium globosum]